MNHGSFLAHGEASDHRKCDADHFAKQRLQSNHLQAGFVVKVLRDIPTTQRRCANPLTTFHHPQVLSNQRTSLPLYSAHLGNLDTVEVALDLRYAAASSDWGEISDEDSRHHHETTINANPRKQWDGKRIVFCESGM